MKPNARFFPAMLVVAAAVLTLASNASAAGWKEKVLYSFQGGNDGAVPAGGVVFDKQGNLYGATSDGGSGCTAGSCGTVFQLVPPANKGGAWSENILHNFQGQDGSIPEGGVILDVAGNVYGTTAYGGSGPCTLFGSTVGCGMVYEMVPPKTKNGAWTEKVLYSFLGNKDGQFPIGDLVFDKAGNLYGATQFGGGYGSCDAPFYQHCGTIFKLIPPKTKGGKWKEKVLYSFKSGKDGANPNGRLALDKGGALYGTTPIGGGTNCHSSLGNGCGVVFLLKPPSVKGHTWAETILHRFRDGADGASPAPGLTPGNDGIFYGAAEGGGEFQSGLIFRLTRARSGPWSERVLYNFVGNQGGQNPGSLIFGSDGNLYGAASGGQDFEGLIFRLNRQTLGRSWQLAVLYNFMRSDDGAGPDAGLIFDEVGNLYGTTVAGGDRTGCTNGCGTVFEAKP